MSITIGKDGLIAEVAYHGYIHLRRGTNPLMDNISLSFEEFDALLAAGKGGVLDEMRKKTRDHLTEIISKSQDRLDKLEGK